MKELIRKSIAASLLVFLGNCALLKVGMPIGPVIFAFGLLGICHMQLNLFTGKCGFIFEKDTKPLELVVILLVNLLSGYLWGMLYSFADVDIVNAAIEKIATWDISVGFFIKSIFCGVVMYVAVYMYKKGTPLGIIFGVPLFIFAGFQHCIANIITLGIARTFDLSIIICIIGNFIGSILVWYLTQAKE